MIATSKGNGKKSNGSGNGHNRITGNGSGKAGGNGNGHHGKINGNRRLKLERLFTEWEKLKADAKEKYQEIDRIEAELLESLTVDDTVELSDGRTGTIQDNFIDRHGQTRNVSYRPCGVRRFEIAIK
jgi:hypothetical protein